MRVSVFGSGYIGLVQAAVFADAGHQVCCMDIDAARIAALQAGEVPLHEPGLPALLQRTTATGDLTFTADAAEAVTWADVLFMAVGTPAADDGAADLTAVLAVAKQVGRYMQSDKLVVNKSTVPVGTADQVAAVVRAVLAERGVDYQVQVASNPEFLKEGTAVEDCQRPDRIVFGTDSPIPMICARHPAWCFLKACGRRGSGYRPMTRQQWRMPSGCLVSGMICI